MEPFDYHRATSVDEARALLEQDEDAKLLAGGQSLLPLMKLELAAPPVLVSLAGIEGLRGIAQEGDTLVVGAGCTHAEVADSAEVAAAIPALADLASHIGDAQVRNRGTLGGSIAHADPAADYPAALLALDGVVRTDRREIAAADFFTGVYETALEEREIVTAVAFGRPEGAAYAKFPNLASRFALVGVFVARGASGVRVAVTGATPVAFRAAALEQALAADFAPGALEGVAVERDDWLDDLDASADYRAHLVGVMARRAVAACA